MSRSSPYHTNGPSTVRRMPDGKGKCDNCAKKEAGLKPSNSTSCRSRFHVANMSSMLRMPDGTAMCKQCRDKEQEVREAKGVKFSHEDEVLVIGCHICKSRETRVCKCGKCSDYFCKECMDRHGLGCGKGSKACDVRVAKGL